MSQLVFYCDGDDAIYDAEPGWRFCPVCGAVLFLSTDRREVKNMSELTTIAGELESQAARLRVIAAAPTPAPAEWSAIEADERKLADDLHAVDPATAATPVAHAPQEPQPASLTNVHASDLPLPSELPPVPPAS